MTNQQIDDYVKQSRQAGISDAEIKQKLQESGWDNNAVSEAFKDSISTPTSTGKPQKDYWRAAYKNFLHFSYFGYFLFLVFLVLWIVKHESVSKFITIWALILTFVVSTLWFVISQLFKKHHKKAILAGYVFLSVIALSLLWNGSGIALLLILYLFYLVYKASKMPVV